MDYTDPLMTIDSLYETWLTNSSSKGVKHTFKHLFGEMIRIPNSCFYEHASPALFKASIQDIFSKLLNPEYLTSREKLLTILYSIFRTRSSSSLLPNDDPEFLSIITSHLCQKSMYPLYSQAMHHSYPPIMKLSVQMLYFSLASPSGLECLLDQPKALQDAIKMYFFVPPRLSPSQPRKYLFPLLISVLKSIPDIISQWSLFNGITFPKPSDSTLENFSIKLDSLESTLLVIDILFKLSIESGESNFFNFLNILPIIFHALQEKNDILGQISFLSTLTEKFNHESLVSKFWTQQSWLISLFNQILVSPNISRKQYMKSATNAVSLYFSGGGDNDIKEDVSSLSNLPFHTPQTVLLLCHFIFYAPTWNVISAKDGGKALILLVNHLFNVAQSHNSAEYHILGHQLIGTLASSYHGIRFLFSLTQPQQMMIWTQFWGDTSSIASGISSNTNLDIIESRYRALSAILHGDPSIVCKTFSSLLFSSVKPQTSCPFDHIEMISTLFLVNLPQSINDGLQLIKKHPFPTVLLSYYSFISGLAGFQFGLVLFNDTPSFFQSIFSIQSPNKLVADALYSFVSRTLSLDPTVGFLDDTGSSKASGSSYLSTNKRMFLGEQREETDILSALGPDVCARLRMVLKSGPYSPNLVNYQNPFADKEQVLVGTQTK